MTLAATWYAPDGTTVDLSESNTGPMLTDGFSGHGAGPVEVTRSPLYGGGSRVRHRHQGEAILNAPVHLTADTHESYIAQWRELVRAFTQTAELGPGRLRITRGDTPWREIEAEYLTGLEEENTDGSGEVSSTSVIQLLAADPNWYGQQMSVLRFVYGEPRNFLKPFPTIDYSQRIGTEDVHIDGDKETWPTVDARGPFSTLTLAKGSRLMIWDAAEPLPAQHRLVLRTDPRWFDAYTQAPVLDGTGQVVGWQAPVDAVADLNWPQVQTFSLRPGTSTITVSMTGVAAGAYADLLYRPTFRTA